MDITRRGLALAALTSATLARESMAADSEPTYGGPLEKYQGRMQAADFDSLGLSQARWKAAPRELAFAAKSKGDVVAWQKALKQRVELCLGGFPKTRVPLTPTTFEVADFPNHTREALAFQSREGVWVFGYLLKPKAVQGPLPVVVCLPGHGRGVDDLAGIDPNGRERTAKVGYQYDYAVQVVEHGMAALAIEMLGFGCRRDATARKAGQGSSSCQPAAGAALLLGETMAAWRTWDVMRACDFIATRKDLDAGRIGCMGISGGGTVTLYAAALDERIRAAFMSCSLCMFRDCILSIPHCIDNYVPGILNWAEMGDIAGLIAPRALFVESGEKDPIFPLAGSREAFQTAHRVYEVLGKPEFCKREEFPAEHEFHGVQGLEFLRAQLA